jgi:hypothetical protein
MKHIIIDFVLPILSMAVPIDSRPIMLTPPMVDKTPADLI